MRDVDNGQCTVCNREVIVEGQTPTFDDEFCLRTKPYCMAPEDEQVDWRATCLHVQSVALRYSQRIEQLEALALEAVEIADALEAEFMIGDNQERLAAIRAAATGDAK